MERAFHVYMLAGKSGVLYVGVTGQLSKRIWQHKTKLVDGFTQKYS
jgi:putative endonuclease